MAPPSAVVPAASSSYHDHANPQWIQLLDLLRMNVSYERCEGVELHTSDGRCILDFLSGYCVHNIGHNHPAVIDALKTELDRKGPAMLQSHVPELAGEAARRLCNLAGGKLQKVFFASSGSEGVEAAIKFARAHTRRNGMLYAKGAFHGLTCGALSLTDGEYWREGFGPLLPETAGVPFGDLDSLRKELATRRYAAFIVEPVQAEAGIQIPSADYLREAQTLCRQYGSLFVLDEVQTGMFRTGRFLAGQEFGCEPDMVAMAKALSGGLIPVGALLMTDAVYESVFPSIKRAFAHTSTFSENALSMRAALATLDVLEQERLGECAIAKGDYLREKLRHRLRGYSMIRDVRGAGLLCGIEFQTPAALGLKLAFEGFRKIHPAMFGQMVVMRLFQEHNVLTQICGNNFMVLKAAPPLVVTEAQIDTFVDALHAVVDYMHSAGAFWSDALSLARRAVHA